jgi:hypothetical protein
VRIVKLADLVVEISNTHTGLFSDKLVVFKGQDEKHRSEEEVVPDGRDSGSYSLEFFSANKNTEPSSRVDIKEN